MINKITLCLTLILCTFNLSYSQSYECDNNFEDCGTPNQSGGGGAGGGSILIANTDLGDSYQHADDYDDDGIEDPSDNCIRHSNPQQYDRDGDGRGDMCDNCLRVYNPEQLDSNNNGRGNLCDSYEEHDAYVYISPCPDLGAYEICGEDNLEATYENDFVIDNVEKETVDAFVNDVHIQENGCNTYFVSTPVSFLALFLLFTRRRFK